MNNKSSIENFSGTDYEEIYSSNYQSFQEKIKKIQEIAKATKRRVPKAVKTHAFLNKELDTYLSIYKKDNLANRLDEPKRRAHILEITKNRLKNSDKQAIINDNADLVLEFARLLLYFEHLVTSYNRVFDHLTETLLSNSESSTKRGNGRKKLHEQDNQRLLDCLNNLKDSLGRELIASDLLKYIRLVKNTYSEQLYIQTPRLTPEEKSLSKEDQQQILKYKIKKRGKGWVDSRIIDFFNVNTGLKGTTK